MANEYLRGNVVRISASFFDSNGQPANPTAVLVAIQKGLLPNQRGENIITFVYGESNDIQLLVTGTYYMDVVADPDGVFTYSWYSTGTVQVADQKNFVVKTRIGN